MITQESLSALNVTEVDGHLLQRAEVCMWCSKPAKNRIHLGVTVIDEKSCCFFIYLFY